MQLKVSHSLDEPLVLPINYHHMLQSIIYQALKEDAEFSKFMHDKGYAMEQRKYKLFTFGPLIGKYKVSGKDIIFFDEISFEIRSVNPALIKALSREFAANGIVYFKHHIPKVDVKSYDREVEEEELHIQMMSPICVYATDIISGKTIYFHPNDEKFACAINENFKRKYLAHTGVEAESDIEIRLESLHPKDKYVTNYKGIYINGWKGKYILRGKRKYLDFLYQTGLGGKNSQGFGMFEIV